MMRSNAKKKGVTSVEHTQIGFSTETHLTSYFIGYLVPLAFAWHEIHSLNQKNLCKYILTNVEESVPGQ